MENKFSVKVPPSTEFRSVPLLAYFRSIPIIFIKILNEDFNTFKILNKSTEYQGWPMWATVPRNEVNSWIITESFLHKYFCSDEF